MSFTKNLSGSFLTPLKQLFYVQVRHRYYADKLKNGPIVKNYGFKEKIFTGGVLPRLNKAEALPMPIYSPKNSWNPKLAIEGQNDYIDILGGRRLKPHDVKYDIPKWLRGKKGNEMQLLLHKQRVFGHTRYEIDHPTAWRNMRKRIVHLYKYLNWKTKTQAPPYYF